MLELRVQVLDATGWAGQGLVCASAHVHVCPASIGVCWLHVGLGRGSTVVLLHVGELVCTSVCVWRCVGRTAAHGAGFCFERDSGVPVSCMGRVLSETVVSCKLSDTRRLETVEYSCIL